MKLHGDKHGQLSQCLVPQSFTNVGNSENDGNKKRKRPKGAELVSRRAWESCGNDSVIMSKQKE